MLSKRWKTITTALGELRELLGDLDHRTDLMQTVLMIREPSSTAAGEAYEGLRRQVVNAVSERMAHLAHLVQIDHALATGIDRDDLLAMLERHFEETALVRVGDPADPRAAELYHVVDNAGGALEVLDPAYVDGVSGRLIRRGKARHAPVADLSRTSEERA